MANHELHLISTGELVAIVVETKESPRNSIDNDARQQRTRISEEAEPTKAGKDQTKHKRFGMPLESLKANCTMQSQFQPQI